MTEVMLVEILEALKVIAARLTRSNEMYRIVNASALRGSEVEKD